jgi:hypothetical protein
VSGKALVWAFSGTLVFGIAVGVHSGPVPETRFIKGPTIYRTHTVTEEVTVTKPLPDSCIKAIGLMQDVVDPLYHQDTLASKSILALTEFGRSFENNEINASNDAIESLRVYKDQLATNNMHSAQSRSELDSWYDQCQKDAGVS